MYLTNKLASSPPAPVVPPPAAAVSVGADGSIVALISAADNAHAFFEDGNDFTEKMSGPWKIFNSLLSKRKLWCTASS